MSEQKIPRLYKFKNYFFRWTKRCVKILFVSFSRFGKGFVILIIFHIDQSCLSPRILKMSTNYYKEKYLHIRISIYDASVWTELLEGIMFWKISVQYNINISIHICKRCLYMSIFDWIMGLQLYSLMHFSIHGVPQLAYILSIFFRNGCEKKSLSD